MEAAAVAVQEEQHHELAPQLQFPPGYHFVPTELELLGYLRGKIEGREQPLAVVNEVAILDWQPGSLVEAYKGYGESKWYFFTVREPSSSNKEEEPNRKVRVPGVKATWKATGSVAPIAAAAAAAASKQQGVGGEPAGDDDVEEKVIVGTKRVLIYQSSDAEEDGKWSMHEYILKGHAKIGQYALCTIQRKQHSDTVDDVGEGISSSNRKRTKATYGDTAKAKRRTKKPPTQPEGLQQQQQLQATASVEAPLQPKPRASRTVAKRKNKASVQDGEGQQPQEAVASFSPAKAPLTPPQQAPPQALQQSAPLLPASPLQGYTSSPTDGMLGASTPMHEEEGTPASNFQNDDDMLLSDLDAIIKSCNQTEQPHIFADYEFIAGSHGQYPQRYQQDYHNSFVVHGQHHYPEPPPFPPGDFFTQDNSNWNHGQLQNYHQEIGGAFAAPGGLLRHGDAQYDDQSPYGQMDYSSMLSRTGYCCSPDQFMGSVEGDGAASRSNGGMGLNDAELFAMDALRDVDPLDCLGAQGESNNPEAFQSQDEPLWSSRSRGQQQHAAIGDGPPPSRCVSEFWRERQ